MAKDAEVASLFQLYQCRATDLLRSHRGQVAGAVIEADQYVTNRITFQNLERNAKDYFGNSTKITLCP